MQYYVESKIPGHEFLVNTDRFVQNISELSSFCFDELDEFVYDIIDNCGFTIEMPFSPYDICSSIQEQACKNLDYSVVSFSKENEILECKVVIPISDYLENRIDEITCDGSFDCRIGEYVAEVLQKYISKSKWHIDRNRLWFGPDSEPPIKPWIIDASSSENDLEFWFEEDPESIMDHLGDFDEAFYIWHFTECAGWAPDIKAIRELCPILLEKYDTALSIVNKINDYFRR